MREPGHTYTPPHPFVSIMLILVVVGLGFLVVGPFLGIALALPFYPGSVEDFMSGLGNPAGDPALKIPLYIVQACATLVGLILAPAWLMRRTNRNLPGFFRRQRLQPLPVLITIFIVMVFMGVNSVLVEWNAEFRFPAFLEEFERWARAREDVAAELTKYLTTFRSGADVLIGMVVIAVLPAIGEEFVFRGLIQNEIHRGTGNVHVAIWIAALMFSAIHMQFFGFVPRLALGALFGYLYYWSGSLSLAMIAHFVNNGVALLAMYFRQEGMLDVDLESPESAPLSVVLTSAVLTGVLLFYFFRYFRQRKPTAAEL